MPVEAMLGKVAGLVATGGSLHHYLALDFTFRPIMAFFNVHTLPGVLYGSREQFLPARQLNEALGEQARVMGRDLASLTSGVSGRTWGPASPGVEVTRPPA